MTAALLAVAALAASASWTVHGTGFAPSASTGTTPRSPDGSPAPPSYGGEGRLGQRGSEAAGCCCYPGVRYYSQPSTRRALTPNDRLKTDDIELEKDVVSDCHADPSGASDSTKAITSCHASKRRVFYPVGTYRCDYRVIFPRVSIGVSLDLYLNTGELVGRRFNGKTLELSGGVRFADPAGVTVRNNISTENVLQFDDATSQAICRCL